jgi:hypothetical protein
MMFCGSKTQCGGTLEDGLQCKRFINLRKSRAERKGLQMRSCADGVWRCHGGGKRGCFLAWQGAERLAAEARLAQRREKGQQLARGRAAAQQPAAAVAAVAPPQLSPISIGGDLAAIAVIPPPHLSLPFPCISCLAVCVCGYPGLRQTTHAALGMRACCVRRSG